MTTSKLLTPLLGVVLAFSANAVLAGGTLVPGNTEGQGANDIGTDSFTDSVSSTETTSDGSQISVSTTSDSAGTTTTTTSVSQTGTTTTTAVTIEVDGVISVTTTVNGQAASSFSIDLSAPNTVIVSDTGSGISQETADGLLAALASAPEAVRSALREIINRSIVAGN